MLHDLDYEVVPVIGSTSDKLGVLLEEFNERYIMTSNPDFNSSMDKIIFSLKYKGFVKNISKLINKDDVVFLGTADTAIHVYSAVRHCRIALVLLELHEKPWFNNRVLRSIARSSDCVICCERNRSRYLMGKWNLERLPYAISNKPYRMSQDRNMKNVDITVSQVVNEIGSRKAIIYQARHIHFADELVQLAKAMNKLDDSFVLVLIGEIDSEVTKDRICSVYKNTICSGLLHAPKHLEMTSYGYIGVTVYQETTLNNMFCAPNKIYEYGAFGIPCLCNDLPGLVETVGIGKAGVCVDWNEIERIKEGILEIEKNYQMYSENALKLYLNEDNCLILNGIMNSEFTGEND